MKSTNKFLFLDVERKYGRGWLRMDCHTADNTRILDMLALVRAGKISVGECFTFRDGQTFRTVMDERYCEIAARRMGQGVLDFGTANAGKETP